MKNSKWYKRTLGVVGAVAAGFGLMLGATMVAYPAISQLVGLAVAQTTTLWNNVKDAAAGDALSNGILVQSTYLFNGVTFDRVRGTGGSMNVTAIGAVTPADAYTNPTTAMQAYALNGAFNGTTWDRVRTATADAMVSTGMTAVGNMVSNGTSFDRMRSATADAMVSTGMTAVGNMWFNGTGWDRSDGVSATNNTAATSLGVLQTVPLSTWSITNTPAVATQATVSKSAGASTIRHVATSVTWCVAAAATPQPPLLIHLRDGATGAGTIIKTWAVSAIASTAICGGISGLNMSGTGNTAMTIETAAAPAADVQATVGMSGYSTP